MLHKKDSSIPEFVQSKTTHQIYRYNLTFNLHFNNTREIQHSGAMYQRK